MEIMKDTRYTRTDRGWQGETEYRFAADQVLQIRTSRFSSGKLTSVATAYRVDRGCYSFVVSGRDNGDYTKTWAVSKPPRVTELSLTRQHESVLTKMDEIEADARAFYAHQAEAKAKAAHPAGAAA